MEALLNSPVLTATVTGILAICGTIATYYLSKRKPKKHPKKYNNVDPVNYAGYEALLKEVNANNVRKDKELERLYDVAEDREKLIDTLRRKENELYKIIEKKNQEISQLRHLREFTEAAKKVPQSSMHNNTKGQTDPSSNAMI